MPIYGRSWQGQNNSWNGHSAALAIGHAGMVVGLTYHIWMTTELLSYQVPTTFLDQLGDLERFFPSFDTAHHG